MSFPEGFMKPNPLKLLELASKYDPSPLEQVFQQMAVPNAQGQDMSNPMLEMGGLVPQQPGSQGPQTSKPAAMDEKSLALLAAMQPKSVAPHWAPPASLPNMTRNIQFAPMVLGQMANGQGAPVQIPNFAQILSGSRR
jgi:hypothetical protein